MKLFHDYVIGEFGHVLMGDAKPCKIARMGKVLINLCWCISLQPMFTTSLYKKIPRYRPDRGILVSSTCDANAVSLEIYSMGNFQNYVSIVGWGISPLTTPYQLNRSKHMGGLLTLIMHIQYITLLIRRQRLQQSKQFLISNSN